MDLVYDDLFAFNTRALCHLRLYGRGDEQIAVAYELEDNPGRSVVNGVEALVRDIARGFGRAPIRVFLCFPDDDSWREAFLSAGAERTEFNSPITAHDVEVAIGQRLPTERPAPYLAARIGGDAHPLLSLIPPPEPERDLTDRLQVVAVADLPWAHNPSRCTHHARYLSLGETYGKYESTYDESRGSDAASEACGAHWFLTLDRDDLSACRYHEADWCEVAAASIELLERLPMGASHEAICELAHELVEGERQQHELFYLFCDPIAWAPGTISITNGQHRTCALKAARAPCVVVDTDGRLARSPTPGDPRRRAETTLACYWAERAAL